MANTKITADNLATNAVTSASIADNSIGITQLNVSDGSNGQALVTNGSGTLSFASVGVSGISSSADATAITIDANEKVGIGTSSPSRKFHVVESANNDVATFINNDATNGYGLNINGGGTASGRYSLRVANQANTVVLQANADGNVGIGTSSPQKTLDVTGTFAISNNTSSYWDFDRDDTDGSLKIADTGTERMRIDTSGNVGIGTTSPGHPLNVVDSGELQAEFSGYSHASAANNSRAASGSIRLGNGAGSTGLLLDYTDQGQTVGLIKNEYVASSSSELRLQSPFLSFYTGTSAAERMRIDHLGKIGIGTSSGTGSIHVTTKDSDGSDVYYVAQNTTSNRLAGYKIFDESGAIGGVFQYDNGGNALNIGTAINTHFSFNTNNTERMRIDASGNVGIGTTDAGNAKLVINGNTSSGANTACIDFDGYGTYGADNSQSINFRMGRTGQATDQAAQIMGIFQGGGATAGQTSVGFKFNTISANTVTEQFLMDAAYLRFKFNTTESPRSNNPQTNRCIIIGPSTSTAVTAGLTDATVLINRSGELYAVDSSHNNTQLTPHNWTLIPDGPSEELAWTYWSQRPNPDNPDQLQGINVDMAKVARKVEDLIGEKLVYTENSNMDDHTHKNIIADIQSTLADLKSRIEALEG